MKMLSAKLFKVYLITPYSFNNIAYVYVYAKKNITSNYNFHLHFQISPLQHLKLHKENEMRQELEKIAFKPTVIDWLYILSIGTIDI